MGKPTGNLAFRRELDDHEERLEKVEASSGITAVNEPEEGQVLSVNEDGDFEWIDAPEPAGAKPPRTIAALINGANGEILSLYSNSEDDTDETIACEHVSEGVYWFKYIFPFPEPVPGRAAPPFPAVLPIHPGGEGEENVVPTVKEEEGSTFSGGVMIELRKVSDGALVDANFFVTVVGPFT